jgi:hypothetical protein
MRVMAVGSTRPCEADHLVRGLAEALVYRRVHNHQRRQLAEGRRPRRSTQRTTSQGGQTSRYHRDDTREPFSRWT